MGCTDGKSSLPQEGEFCKRYQHRAKEPTTLLEAFRAETQTFWFSGWRAGGLSCRRRDAGTEPSTEAGGVGLDDLEQVGFLALTKAAETWNPDSGAFSTWLTFQLKTAFAAAYFMRTERDRKDPLNDAVSLDTPPAGTDEDVMLRDIIPDAAAELAFEDAEHKDLCSAVQSAVLSLPEDQRTAIIREFWYGQKPDPKTRSKAMKSLRRPSVSRALRTYY